MEFFEIEYLLEKLEKHIEEENKRANEDQKDYKKASSMTNKMPKISNTDYGGYKTPKMDISSIAKTLPKPRF